jgi:uncharacterized protein
MNYIKLGSTDLIISEVGFGCIPIIRLSKETAVDVLRHALDMGITFFDTANMYRDSEEKIGRAFEGNRDKVVIATKTLNRDADGAIKNLENSLRMLKTDFIDLYQLHQLAHENDFNAVMAADGALKALLKAREQGKIRYIGVSSHSLPMAIRLVETGLFHTIQFPFNFIEEAAKEELLPTAIQKRMGILAMKPFAGGVIDNAEIVFKYLRQFPDVLPIPGFDSIESVDQVVSFYEHPKAVSEKDRQLMEQYRLELGKKFCRRCEYCQPCPQGVMITMAMGYKIIASRMSPAVSVDFCKAFMKSIELCTQCEECVQRCPYQLPIPDMLKEYYDLYEQHRKQLLKR